MTHDPSRDAVERRTEGGRRARCRRARRAAAEGRPPRSPSRSAGIQVRRARQWLRRSARVRVWRGRPGRYPGGVSRRLRTDCECAGRRARMRESERDASSYSRIGGVFCTRHSPPAGRVHPSLDLLKLISRSVGLGARTLSSSIHGKYTTAAQAGLACHTEVHGIPLSVSEDSR